MSIITNPPGLMSGTAIGSRKHIDPIRTDGSGRALNHEDVYRPNDGDTMPQVTLQGAAATTHQALEAAARNVERINAELTAAQAEFRKALAAHMAAITGKAVGL